MITEKSTGEKYFSKASMAKHEKGESKSEKKSELKKAPSKSASLKPMIKVTKKK